MAFVLMSATDDKQAIKEAAAGQTVRARRVCGSVTEREETGEINPQLHPSNSSALGWLTPVLVARHRLVNPKPFVLFGASSFCQQFHSQTL